MRYLIAIGFFIIHCFVIYGQGEIDSTPKALIRNEISTAILFNSNGWGGCFTYGKMKSVKSKSLFSFDFSAIKDPKEIKIVGETGRYVYGKTNEFINFRITYGKLNRMFEKKDIGGVEIRWFYRFGLAVGIEKPIYYKVGDDLKLEKFSQATHLGDIRGKANFFKGFGESSVLPGLNLAIGTSFEFGKRDLIISAFEGGISFDIFPKTIDIMANEYNKFYFISLFLSYRIGKVINPRLKYLNK